MAFLLIQCLLSLPLQESPISVVVRVCQCLRGVVFLAMVRLIMIRLVIVLLGIIFQGVVLQQGALDLRQKLHQPDVDERILELAKQMCLMQILVGEETLELDVHKCAMGLENRRCLMHLFTGRGKVRLQAGEVEVGGSRTSIMWIMEWERMRMRRKKRAKERRKMITVQRTLAVTTMTRNPPPKAIRGRKRPATAAAGTRAGGPKKINLGNRDQSPGSPGTGRPRGSARNGTDGNDPTATTTGATGATNGAGAEGARGAAGSGEATGRVTRSSTKRAAATPSDNPGGAKKRKKKDPPPSLRVKNTAPTTKGSLYVLGENDFGQLGMGDRKTYTRPTKNTTPGLPKFVQVAAGRWHCIALSDDLKKIFTWGDNSYAQLGRDPPDFKGIDTTRPSEVERLARLKAEGKEEEANAKGSKSARSAKKTPKNKKNQEKPEEPKEPKEPDKPNPDMGTEIRETPAEVVFPRLRPGSRFVQVVATDTACFVLTEDGDVWGWGTFREGDAKEYWNTPVIGFRRDMKFQKRPYRYPKNTELKNVKRLAAGAEHVLAQIAVTAQSAGNLSKTPMLCDRDCVRSWGSHKNGQLGHRSSTDFTCLNVGLCAFSKDNDARWRKEYDFEVETISTGKYQSFVTFKDKHIYSWGYNKHYQTGHMDYIGTDTNTWIHGIPTNLDLPRVRPYFNKQYPCFTSVSAGVQYGVAIPHNDRLCRAWGHVSYGLVGNPMDEIARPPLDIDKGVVDRPILVRDTTKAVMGRVSEVAAGATHTVAVLENGRAMGWGRNGWCQLGETGPLFDPNAAGLNGNNYCDLATELVLPQRRGRVVSAAVGAHFTILLVDEDAEPDAEAVGVPAPENGLRRSNRSRTTRGPY
ncbi:regulator of chromosome condensation 1/beta-lactamase-inhibitor protein II [Aspergillus multicolor]|uniref:RCC1 domain-containing protein n=1 Tax=Aspergillus multicolor TaxID=41759 RepID=UPI003CCCFBFD